MTIRDLLPIRMLEAALCYNLPTENEEGVDLWANADQHASQFRANLDQLMSSARRTNNFRCKYCNWAGPQGSNCTRARCLDDHYHVNCRNKIKALPPISHLPNPQIASLLPSKSARGYTIPAHTSSCLRPVPLHFEAHQYLVIVPTLS